MGCSSCQIPVSRNFVSQAVLGKSVAQDDLLSGLTDWWNSLEPMYQYMIIGGAGLAAVVILLLLIRPAPKSEVKGLEELIRLKMLKELAE